jgi:hypothetical protein
VTDKKTNIGSSDMEDKIKPQRQILRTGKQEYMQ